jgi:hypothetical protein
LRELAARDPDLGLVRPVSGEITESDGEHEPGVGVDEQRRERRGRQPDGVVGDDLVDVGGLGAERDLAGQLTVGRRFSPGSANGAR